MQWFEPLIAIGAISLVVLPIIMHFRKAKKGKNSCGCDCKSCGKDCVVKYINSKEFKSGCKNITDSSN